MPTHPVQTYLVHGFPGSIRTHLTLRTRHFSHACAIELITVDENKFHYSAYLNGVADYEQICPGERPGLTIVIAD